MYWIYCDKDILAFQRGNSSPSWERRRRPFLFRNRWPVDCGMFLVFPWTLREDERKTMKEYPKDLKDTDSLRGSRRRKSSSSHTADVGGLTLANDFGAGVDHEIGPRLGVLGGVAQRWRHQRRRRRRRLRHQLTPHGKQRRGGSHRATRGSLSLTERLTLKI